jgi:hypothetical protein
VLLAHDECERWLDCNHAIEAGDPLFRSELKQTLRLQALRRKAEAELGERFDIREFHSQLLRDGALPLDVLEAKVERWIAAQAAAGG